MENAKQYQQKKRMNQMKRKTLMEMKTEMEKKEMKRLELTMKQQSKGYITSAFQSPVEKGFRSGLIDTESSSYLDKIGYRQFAKQRHLISENNAATLV